MSYSCLRDRKSDTVIMSHSSSLASYPGFKGRVHTSSAYLSARRRESDGSGLIPLQLLICLAKWVHPYLSPSGFGLHCRETKKARNYNNLRTHMIKPQDRRVLHELLCVWLPSCIRKVRKPGFQMLILKEHLMA